MISRSRLINQILQAKQRLCLISAFAGAGKTKLLRQLADRLQQPIRFGPFQDVWCQQSDVLLWDLPTKPDFPVDIAPLLQWLDGKDERRIIIAARPGVEIQGINRALLYHQAKCITSDQLFFDAADLSAMVSPEQAEQIIGQTAGWPCLVEFAKDQSIGMPSLVAFFKNHFLADLSDTTVALLNAALMYDAALNYPDDDPELAESFQEIAPLLARKDGRLCLSVRARTILTPLAKATAKRRMKLAGNEAVEWAEVERKLGKPDAAIETLQQAHLYDIAYDWFVEASSFMLIQYVGPERYASVLNGFPHEEDQLQDKELLVAAKAMHALKAGNIERARFILDRSLGPASNNLSLVFSPNNRFSLIFRVFRLTMVIYEETIISEKNMGHVFELLAELPLDSHLYRGAFYNSILEYYLRNRRLLDAQSAAAQALYHYQHADVPILCFYISLFQTVLALTSGNLASAQDYLKQTQDYFSQVPFESPSDARILSILKACVDYEDGHFELLAKFLSDDFDHFVTGEIWPSLADFALKYGSEALCSHYSVSAARNYLDRWRADHSASRRFHMILEVYEATILQNGNRWIEASERLMALQSRVNKTWVEAAEPELARLSDGAEIAITIAWMRQLIHEVPTRTMLLDQLAALSSNQHVTYRQKITIMIWQASVAKRQRNATKARTALVRAFEEVGRLGCIAVLIEEKVFLDDLIADKRLVEFVQSSPVANAVFRRLKEISLPGTHSLNLSNLTRRESNILLMIAEGRSNKAVARNLGISEATVKFHLSNLYRKLGCTRRKEAIATAHSLGWIG